MYDRNVRIMELLANNETIKVDLLAELLDVSQVTLRKDLDRLEKSGIVKRYHGYASLDGADDTSKRIAFFYPVKKRIAAAAAQLIKNGESIMVESGSCCTLFAEELALNKKNITIITNSLFMINYIHEIKNIKIMLLGGYYLPDSKVMVGSIVSKFVQNFFVDKLFIGADGFLPEYGFMGDDYLRVETMTELAARANKVFVLTESAKFTRRGTYNLIQFDRLAGIITDDGIPKESEEVLIKNNVQLFKVPLAGEKPTWRKFPGLPPVLY